MPILWPTNTTPRQKLQKIPHTAQENAYDMDLAPFLRVAGDNTKEMHKVKSAFFEILCSAQKHWDRSYTETQTLYSEYKEKISKYTH